LGPWSFSQFAAGPDEADDADCTEACKLQFMSTTHYIDNSAGGVGWAGLGWKGLNDREGCRLRETTDAREDVGYVR